jgi:oligopeptide/dipeptide ABC transporter ATP-binding protein
MLFIAHDLAVVRILCHQVAVLFMGEIVELAGTQELFGAPAHPYTRQLLRSAVANGGNRVACGAAAPASSAVFAPALAERHGGCRYQAQCPEVFARCRTETPPIYDLGGHQVACFLHDGRAPIVEPRSRPL